MTKRNGKGVWMREIFKMFDASLEWFLESVNVRDDEIYKTRRNQEN